MWICAFLNNTGSKGIMFLSILSMTCSCMTWHDQYFPSPYLNWWHVIFSLDRQKLEDHWRCCEHTKLCILRNPIMYINLVPKCTILETAFLEIPGAPYGSINQGSGTSSPLKGNFSLPFASTKGLLPTSLAFPSKKCHARWDCEGCGRELTVGVNVNRLYTLCGKFIELIHDNLRAIGTMRVSHSSGPVIVPRGKDKIGYNNEG